MTRIIFVVVTLLFAAIICPSFAQEALTPEELFRWVLEGEYSRIYHLDRAALAKADMFDSFELVTAHWPKQFPFEPLPPAMQDEFESRTIFQMGRIKVSIWKEGDSVESGQNPTAFAKIGDKDFLFTNIGEHLFVYRFIDAASLIRKALKSSQIIYTETYVMEKPVYSFSQDNQLFYLFVTDSQEMLLTRKLNLLRLMVSTGFGQTPGFFHDQNYADLIELAPTLGQYWTAYDLAITARVDIAIMKQKDVNEEEIARTERKLQKANHLNIVNWVVGDTLGEQRVFVFGDEELAKGYEERIKRRSKQWQAEAEPSDDPSEFQHYLQERSKSKKWIVDGRIVRSVITYDDKLVQSYIKGYKAIEAQQKDTKNQEKDQKD